MSEEKPHAPEIPADSKPPADVAFIPDKDSPGTLVDVFNQPEVREITPLRDKPGPGFSGRFTPDGERKAQAAAVHGDALWGGPRWILNATADPVWVETKEQYFALLAREGLHMRDQQESRLPDVERTPKPTPEHLTPHPAIAPLTKQEAETFGVMDAVLAKYGLIESLWCNYCFARNVHHGMRCIVDAHRVMLECRGGQAVFESPVGEPNIILRTLANTTRTRADVVGGTISSPTFGTRFLPAQILDPMEGQIIRAYFGIMLRRNLEPRWHHHGCWSGNPFREDDAMAIRITDTTIVALCQCFQLFERNTAIRADTIQ